MNVPIEENRREKLSQHEFVVVCPSCHKKIPTGYTLWDIEILEENNVPTDVIRCQHCEHGFTYGK